jgi:Domain of unknown function (DUF4105)
MARAMGLITTALIAAIIIGLTVWGCFALMYRGDFSFAHGLIVLCALALFMLIGKAPAIRPALPLLAALAVSFAALFIWWSTIRPSDARIWAAPLARKPAILVEGDRYTVENLRNFRWRASASPAPGSSGEEIAEERWETRVHDLSKVSGVDLFFSYWTGPLIAHLVVSVTFDDAPPLAFSIEIRREDGESYSALAGFFKSYELIIVAADERDIIALRTNVWKEDVRLYRLGVSRAKARDLLLGYAREINALSRQARWYHTLTDNCTTIAYRLARELWPSLKPDWRILLPGRAPELAYEIGALDTTRPLAELQAAAAISEKARAIPEGADFSDAIRQGVPRPVIE